MSTRLSDDERAELAATARRLLAHRSSTDAVRALLDDPVGHDPALLAEMVGLGWGASHLPEDLGGYGIALGDTHAVLIELGRALVGGPLVISSVVAAGTLAAGDPGLAGEVVPAIAEGSRIVTVAIAGQDGNHSELGLGATWSATGDGIVLDGRSCFVLDAHLADQAVVFARGPAGVAAGVVDLGAAGVSSEPVPLVDQTRRASHLTFAGVVVPAERLLAPAGSALPLLERAVDLGATAAALDSFGVGELVLERTTDYVKQRTQFGRPIGSFQAIKHRLADAVLLVETSRVAVAEAAAQVDPTSTALAPVRAVAASTAKAYVGDAMARLCREALQSHGGIGFTWEHDMHLHLKRVFLNQALFGTSSWHRRRVADVVLPVAG